MNVDECKNIPGIVQGERKELTVTLLNAQTGEAIDISGATEIQSVHPLTSGSNLIKKLEKVAVAEVTEITCVADVNSNLASKYFIIYSPTQTYVFWFSVDGAGSPPVVSGATITEVAISENATPSAVASQLETQISSKAAFTASVISEVVTVTNASTGDVDEPKDFATGFSFEVTTEGAEEVTDSIEVTGTGKLKIKLSKNETPLLKAENRQTMFIAVDFPAPTGRKIYKITDAYDVFETSFSLD